MTHPGKLRVAQCWDDGVESDEPLAELLRSHGAKATFNLNAGLADDPSASAWTYGQSAIVRRLGWARMLEVYDGFTVANHSLTHPMALDVAPARWLSEVRDGRSRLQDHFAQPVDGFAYPFGVSDERTAAIVRQCGHTYGRTVGPADADGGAPDPWRLAPDAHFADPDVWAKYEAAKVSGHQTFWFWGHRYELTTPEARDAFADLLDRVAADPESEWCEVGVAAGARVAAGTDVP